MHDLRLKGFDPKLEKGGGLSEALSLGLEGGEFRAVLDTDEKKHSDAHEEHEVERHGDANYAGRPHQRRRENADDER